MLQKIETGLLLNSAKLTIPITIQFQPFQLILEISLHLLRKIAGAS